MENKIQSKIHTRPSDVIEIKKLERETDRLLAFGFIVAICVHAVLGIYITFEKTMDTVTRPIPVELIIRPPRSTRPFKIHDKRLRKRMIYRKPFTIGKPATDMLSYEMSLPHITPEETVTADSLDIEYEPDISVEMETERFITEKFDYDKPIERRPQNLFSFKDEMLTVDDFQAFNEGQIKDLVFFNPDNKFTIRGIITLPHFASAISPPIYLSTGINGLAEALDMFSDLIVSRDDMCNLYQNRSLNYYPFIYISCSETWEYFPYECKTIGDYLKNGGFAVFENLLAGMEYSPAEASLRQFIRDALGSKARFQPIPNEHALYHCFFDFDDGPPIGSEIQSGNSNSRPVFYLEGIWIDNRLVAIYSNKGYGRKWASRENNIPQLKMGINMVVYALMQSGGKAEKKIDYALKPGTKILRWNIEMAQSQDTN